MKPLPTLEQLRAVWEKTRVDPSIVDAYLQRVKPSWHLFETPQRGEDGCHGFRRGNIQVLVSVSREEDGNIWIHVSLCGRRGPDTTWGRQPPTSYFLPSQEDLKRVKNDFIGDDRWAYQVFPDEANYINQNPYVLHLYALLENRNALPDFTHGIGSI